MKIIGRNWKEIRKELEKNRKEMDGSGRKWELDVTRLTKKTTSY